MSRFLARVFVTGALLAAWPLLCIGAALYVTGLIANGILGEWAK